MIIIVVHSDLSSRTTMTREEVSHTSACVSPVVSAVSRIFSIITQWSGASQELFVSSSNRWTPHDRRIPPLPGSSETRGSTTASSAPTIRKVGKRTVATDVVQCSAWTCSRRPSSSSKPSSHTPHLLWWRATCWVTPAADSKFASQFVHAYDIALLTKSRFDKSIAVIVPLSGIIPC